MQDNTPLIDALYNLTVDSAEYEEFMRSWDSVTESWSAVDSDTDTQREQQALLEHFHRAEQIFARIGRADLTNDNPQTMINNRTNAALVMDDQGQIIAALAAM
ncbi:MAG: hypothetical protein RIC89_15920, partial [Pseudomonadales bacterium]